MSSLQQFLSCAGPNEASDIELSVRVRVNARLDATEIWESFMLDARQISMSVVKFVQKASIL